MDERAPQHLALTKNLILPAFSFLKSERMHMKILRLIVAILYGLAAILMPPDDHPAVETDYLDLDD